MSIETKLVLEDTSIFAVFYFLRNRIYFSEELYGDSAKIHAYSNNLGSTLNILVDLKRIEPSSIKKQMQCFQYICKDEDQSGRKISMLNFLFMQKSSVTLKFEGIRTDGKKILEQDFEDEQHRYAKLGILQKMRIMQKFTLLALDLEQSCEIT